MTRVVALVPDLMDRSRVEAGLAARATVAFVDEPADLAAAAPGAALVLVDLEARGALDAVAAVAAGDGHPRLVGFGSHVARDLLDEARRAGCDEVLARSAVFRRLNGLVGPEAAPGPPGHANDPPATRP